MDTLATIFQYLGGASAAFITYKVASFAWLYIRPSSLYRYHHGKPGTRWALVTGASDGIGLGFANILSSEGFNILLHGRNLKKLAGVKESLEKQYPTVQYQIVIADASDPNADVDEIVTAARGLPGQLTVLINNVGGVPFEPMFGTLAEIDQSYADKILNLNARFPAQLTRALIPLLTNNSPSLIINISSMAALHGLPYLSMYSASKAFNYCFSQALKTEMKAEGNDVEILGMIIGNVSSGTNKAEASAFTPTSLQMAKEALARVGCGKANVWGWYRHAIQGLAFKVLPASMLDSFSIQAIQAQKAITEKTKSQ